MYQYAWLCGPVVLSGVLRKYEPVSKLEGGNIRKFVIAAKKRKMLSTLSADIYKTCIHV